MTPLAADEQEPGLVGTSRTSLRSRCAVSVAHSPRTPRAPARRRVSSSPHRSAHSRSASPTGRGHRWAFFAWTRHQPDLARRLQLGYAPLAGVGLCDHLNRCCLTRLVQAGRRRVIHREDGRARRAGPRQPRHDHQPRHRFDRLRDRVTFPVKDKTGRCSGSPAALPRDGSSAPKYLDTARGKACTLHGLSDGRRVLADDAVPVRVEGPVDRIAVTVATGGTYVGLAPGGPALGPQQHTEARHRPRRPSHHRRVRPRRGWPSTALAAYGPLRPLRRP